MAGTPEVHLIAGSYPEAIKLAPVARQLLATGRLRPILVATGRHPTAAAAGWGCFGLRPDAVLTPPRGVGAPDLGELVPAIESHLRARDPRAVVVLGYSAAAAAGATAALWRQVPAVHLEAGLGTGDLPVDYPHSGNRTLMASMCRLHLAPTGHAARNLLATGVPGEQVLITGSTVVDAALEVAARRVPIAEPTLAAVVAAASAHQLRMVLVSAQRPESWGAPLNRLLRAVRRLIAAYPDVHVVLPTHPNPAVRAQINARLYGLDRVIITDPLPYATLTRTLSRADLVLTDSDGIVEEAPSFRVPVLVVRDETERVEAIEAGCARLVGTDENRIVGEVTELLDNPRAYAAMAGVDNPYGDGFAAFRAEQALAAVAGTAHAIDCGPMARAASMAA